MTGQIELSVILPTDTLDTIRRTLEHLVVQSARDRMELVIVTPSEESLDLPDDVRDAFAAVQIVEVGSDAMLLLNRARAAGIHAARAPIVALGETHSFPEPEWAAALLEAHRRDWVAVGPAMICGNGSSKVSWANFFIDFGPWIERREGTTMDRLPGHNAAYKRDALLGFGDELETELASEWGLQAKLRDRAGELWFEPAARTRHLNVVGRASLRARFDHGRLWSVDCGREWPLTRRLLYIAGAPLIPFRRFPAIYREVRRTGRGRDLRLIGLIWVELAADAAGELVGYVRGGYGPSDTRFTDSELHRARYAGIPQQAT